MNAIILSIGDELVLGQSVDTNSAWLSGELARVGACVLRHVTVGDTLQAIEAAIREAVPTCQWLIVTGGLGPTRDDLTRLALARVLGVELELNEVWMARLLEFFQQRGRKMPESNRIQAMIPRGARMLENPNGTAAGIAAMIGDCSVYLLPGVPSEMKPMFSAEVLPYVAGGASGGCVLSRTLHTFGLGESAVGETLGELMERGRNPSVGTTVRDGVVSIRINARFATHPRALEESEFIYAQCRKKLGDLIYGQEDQTLADAVAELLKEKWLSIASAESCTGGLLAKCLTDVPGSSAYFQQGWVTYSNESKIKRLGVSENLINTYGAVSEPVVEAMARHARRLAGADLALAISGIAGPSGGTEAKPVGTVCIALAYPAPGKTGEEATGATLRTFRLPGDRHQIRDRATKTALALLRYHLLGKPMPF